MEKTNEQSLEIEKAEVVEVEYEHPKLLHRVLANFIDAVAVAVEDHGTAGAAGKPEGVQFGLARAERQVAGPAPGVGRREHDLVHEGVPGTGQEQRGDQDRSCGDPGQQVLGNALPAAHVARPEPIPPGG